MRTSLKELSDQFRKGLLENTIPFWAKHAVDRRYGGYMFSVDRKGEIIDTDKSIWFQGRFAWMLATLYLKVRQDSDWIYSAESGVRFLTDHGFDSDGRMFFHVSRQGHPIRKRRYYFSEVFATMAFAAHAAATHDVSLAAQARRLFGRIISYYRGEPQLPSKFTDYRQTKSLANPMILLATCQVLRETIGYPDINSIIDSLILDIERDFMKPEEAAVMECVGLNGEILDHFDGRLLNPGHAIEAAWFILHEARIRPGELRLVKLGTQILEWMWERGWDKEHGGLFYYRDLRDLPIQEYWHDMKFWWPHCEAITATLLAWHLTREEKYFKQFELVYQWTMEHFPDAEYGEWFGYLHRDGTVSTTLKGNMWKGGFHIPRMQLYCWQLIEAELSSTGPDPA